MKKNILLIWFLCLMVFLSGCNQSTNGLSNIKVTEELILGDWKNIEGGNDYGYRLSINKDGTFIYDGAYGVFSFDEAKSEITITYDGTDSQHTYKVEFREVDTNEYLMDWSGEYSGGCFVRDDNAIEETEPKENGDDSENNLTDGEKAEICEYMQDRYEYYRGFPGDVHTIVVNEASDKFRLPADVIEEIWLDRDGHNSVHDLTDEEKAEICEYIQGQYEYYRGFPGDVHTIAINEASDKFRLPAKEIEEIWLDRDEY